MHGRVPACAECLPLPPNSLCDLTCVYMVKKFTSRPPTFCSSMIARLVRVRVRVSLLQQHDSAAAVGWGLR